jgi:hypothetical protein
MPGEGSAADYLKDDDMTGKQAKELSGRSETWLRNHACVWCGQTLWRALTRDCGAIYERCDPSKKNFSEIYDIAHRQG